ncbi:GlsB/YeaQ/YmgE family stress response membrane protein [Kineococcus sp. R86509]|uniref:GlsB/YeaQ/YmgE family stress response membrane protein n=1 Tax=Kineococcus sp. R86509 TaxID=3093851 RepID=UPI0036D3EF70
MHVDGIISAIVIGAIIGVLARLVLPGRQNISILLTIIVGIVAAFIGTALARAIGVDNTPRIDWIEIILQVVVAAVGVTIVGSLRGRRR